jgi:hypothetical protein
MKSLFPLSDVTFIGSFSNNSDSKMIEQQAYFKIFHEIWKIYFKFQVKLMSKWILFQIWTIIMIIMGYLADRKSVSFFWIKKLKNLRSAIFFVTLFLEWIVQEDFQRMFSILSFLRSRESSELNWCFRWATNFKHFNFEMIGMTKNLALTRRIDLEWLGIPLCFFCCFYFSNLLKLNCFDLLFGELLMSLTPGMQSPISMKWCRLA